MEVHGQLHSRPLFSRKEPQHPLDRRLGGPQSESGCFGEDRDNFTRVLICHYLITMCLKSIEKLKKHSSQKYFTLQYSKSETNAPIARMVNLGEYSSLKTRALQRFYFCIFRYLFQLDGQTRATQLLGGVVMHSGSINEVVGSRTVMSGRSPILALEVMVVNYQYTYGIHYFIVSVPV